MRGLKGKKPVTVDDKNRVLLPSTYRKLLPEDVVVAKDPNKEFPGLRIYTSDDFEQWIENVMTGKGGYQATNLSHDEIIDEYYENSEDVTLDSAGRILIPASLREYAGIERDAVIAGHRDHLTIRAAGIQQRYEQVREQRVSVYEQPSADVSGTGDGAAKGENASA